MPLPMPRGLPSHEEISALLQRPLADSESIVEIGCRICMALAKIIEQNEMILIEMQSRRR